MPMWNGSGGNLAMGREPHVPTLVERWHHGVVARPWSGMPVAAQDGAEQAGVTGPPALAVQHGPPEARSVLIRRAAVPSLRHRLPRGGLHRPNPLALNPPSRKDHPEMFRGSFVIALALALAGTVLPVAASDPPAEDRAADVAETMPKADIKEEVPVRARSEVPAGWRAREINGVVHWCKRQQETGSRIRTEDKCVTPEEFDVLQQDAKKFLDDMSRGARNPKGG